MMITLKLKSLNGIGLDSIHLIEALDNGYRMKKPDFAPNFIGEILVNCWKKEAQERPSFSQLEEIIRENTEASVSCYYGNLDVPYEKCNEEKDAPLVKHLGLSKLLDDKLKLQESHSAAVSISLKGVPVRIHYKVVWVKLIMFGKIKDSV